MNTYTKWSRVLLLCSAPLWTAVMACAQNSATEAPKSANTPAAVMHFEAAKVDAAFAKGGILVDGTEDGHFMVITARREKPAPAEIHAKYTDVIYVVQGAATFVTGGELVDGKTSAPDEIRGPSIQGGETRKLAKGDVIIVPNGTPHQLVEVTNPFLYYVVKVR